MNKQLEKSKRDKQKLLVRRQNGKDKHKQIEIARQMSIEQNRMSIRQKYKTILNGMLESNKWNASKV